MTLFAIIAILMTLATAALVLVPLLRRPENRSPVAAAAVALAIPAAVLVAYLGASNYRWTAPPVPVVAGEPAAAGDAAGPLAEAIRSLETRLAENPGDPEGWVLLGSSYAATGRPEEARNAFQKALDLSGGTNLDARLGVAEATLLIDQNAIGGEAGVVIEEVLAAAPRNPKALWYGGMVALVRGEPELARTRWETLLELQPPQRIREIVEEELGRLRGGAPPQAQAQAQNGAGEQSQPGTTGASAQGIAVAVTLGEGIGAQVKSGAPLFVFVRDGSAQGPPVAVVRRAAGELPLELVISDRDSMMPGRSLTGLKSAAIVARVANGGDPLPQPGDLYGEARWESGAGGPVRIVIDQRVQ